MNPRKSCHSLAWCLQSHSWFSWTGWGKPLPRHYTEMGFSTFCCPPVFPLSGNSCDSVPEGVGSLLIATPNHGENKQSHCKEPSFPPNIVEEHINFTVPYPGTAINILQEQGRRQEQASLVLFVFLSHLENWSMARASWGLNIEA